MPADILERHLVDVWRQQRLPTVGLRTEDGEELRILYPGRPTDGAGPDFADAVIECGHRRLTADVELHMRSSQWQQHGHQRDPAYNRVGLHVVLQADCEANRRQDGQTVPVLAVGRYLRAAPRRLSTAPARNCPGARRSPQAIGRRLDRAGDDRFRAKVARFAADLARSDPGQVLFEGVMEALGYSRNKAPFRELARRLPLAAMAAERLETVQARLFGAAGLLPSQRTAARPVPPDADTLRLEALWRAAPPLEPMPSGSWQLLRVRPNNSPLRRMAAMGHLLERYPRLPDGLLGLLPGAPHRRPDIEIGSGLLVSAAGYWAEHYDFACPCAPNPTLLGRGRAGEIVINVLMPFAAALGESRAPAIFEACHRLAANSLEAHMAAQLGVGSSVVNSARRQQGLLHLYSAFCTRGQCAACILG